LFNKIIYNLLYI